LAGGFQAENASADLRRGLSQEGGAGGVPAPPGGSPPPGPQQAGPGAGIFHHRGRNRPGPAHSAAQGRQGDSNPPALGGGGGGKAGLPADQDPVYGQAGAI